MGNKWLLKYDSLHFDVETVHFDNSLADESRRWDTFLDYLESDVSGFDTFLQGKSLKNKALVFAALLREGGDKVQRKDFFRKFFCKNSEGRPADYYKYGDTVIDPLAQSKMIDKHVKEKDSISNYKTKVVYGCNLSSSNPFYRASLKFLNLQPNIDNFLSIRRIYGSGGFLIWPEYFEEGRDPYREWNNLEKDLKRRVVRRKIFHFFSLPLIVASKVNPGIKAKYLLESKKSQRQLKESWNFSEGEMDLFLDSRVYPRISIEGEGKELFENYIDGIIQNKDFSTDIDVFRKRTHSLMKKILKANLFHIDNLQKEHRNIAEILKDSNDRRLRLKVFNNPDLTFPELMEEENKGTAKIEFTVGPTIQIPEFEESLKDDLSYQF